MATTRNHLQFALTSTLTTVLGTVGSGYQWILKELILCNTGPAVNNLTVRGGNGTGVANTLLSSLQILPAESKFVALTTVLTSGDTLTGGSAVSSGTVGGSLSYIQEALF